MSGPDECPKCGAGWSNGAFGGHYGDPFSGPRFKREDSREFLEFTCKECGYVHTEPTKDQTRKRS
jgi:hypothetical protein